MTDTWKTTIVVFAVVSLLMIIAINIPLQAMATTIKLQLPQSPQQQVTNNNGIVLRPTNIDLNGSPHLYLMLTRDEEGFKAEIQQSLLLIGSYKNGSLNFNETLAKQIISEKTPISAGDLHHWFLAFSNFQHFPQNITVGLQKLTDYPNNRTIKPLEIQLTDLPQRFYELDRSSIPVDSKPYLLDIAVKWSDSNIDYYMVKVSCSHNYLYLD